LLMRNLNEVFSGGLGGFSVACLVVSMLQLMPKAQSQNLNGDIGGLLLSFFELYGKKFDMTNNCISLNPPGYYAKDNPKSIGKEKWSIIDPNNDENDISAGSTQAPLIADLFADAHQVITETMRELKHAGPELRRNQVILRPIFGGNYQSFIDQRQHLRRIHDQMYSGSDRNSRSARHYDRVS